MVTATKVKTTKVMLLVFSSDCNSSSGKVNKREPVVTSKIFNLECYTLNHHCITYFIAFWLILEILRNSRTLGESWGFRYFHIWVFSNFGIGVIWFYLFYLQLFLLSKYERGNKMTFPKIKKYWGFNKKIK